MGRKLIDLTNQQFGRLFVLKRGPNNSSGSSTWICNCSCGKINFQANGGDLRRGDTKSCGCLKKETIQKFNKQTKTTHGMTNSPEFITWSLMKQRCINSNTDDYHNYGGRGIIVCDRWIDSFENFYEDMGSRPSNEHSLDRINVDGNYEPLNCRWATKTEQSQNQRTNIIKNINQANEIRKLYITGNYSQQKLAKKYNCSQTTICRIINNISWKDSDNNIV